MSITKVITNTDGSLCNHHKVRHVIVQAADRTVVGVESWKDITAFYDNAKSTFQACVTHVPLQANLTNAAETSLVSDPDSFLFGGVVTPDVTQNDLDKAKTKKKAEIASARSVEMYADKTTTLGVFGSSESDNNKLSIAIQVTQLAAAAGQPAECGYKDVNGVYSIYTLAQLEQIALEIAAQVIPLYEQESSLVAQVDAATTIEEVELIGFV